jgi:Holliday junction resolvase RusA-like endonuclease
MNFECFIPGPVKAQDRPRAYRAGNIIKFYDTTEVKDYKAFAKTVVAANKPPGLFTQPLVMFVIVNVLKPKSWAKGRQHADTKPDVDNFAKIICDICEGLVYVNDSQVVRLIAEKRLAEKPGVFIEVNTL